MPAWLSEEWVAASGELLARAGPVPGGASGVVLVEVTGEGGGSYWREWSAGVPVRGGAGKPPAAPQLTLTLSGSDGRAFWEGRWSPSVAYMRGELKTAGDTGLLLRLLAATARPDRAPLHRSVAALAAGG